MRREKRHLGERLHSLLLQAYGLKDRAFPHDAVERRDARLNAARTARPPMIGEVL